MPMLAGSTYTINFPHAQYQQIYKKRNGEKSSSSLKGTKRVIKLFILCALLPGFFLIAPLYLRFRVYIQQIYPIGVSDMRIIDNKISTTWCQKQLIHANTTFNAYVLAQEPQISSKREEIDMRRFLELKDGSKEYWGFYLLKGSSFTVSSCVRWPGASLIIIEGHKNLKECAYVGDNSSEETDKSISSEEDKNLTAISQMTKVAPGMIINNSETKAFALKNSNQNIENKRPEKSNSKRQNIHLKYAEDIYLKENQKKKNFNEKLQQKNITSKSPSEIEVLNDIYSKMELLGNRSKQAGRLQQVLIKENNTENATEVLEFSNTVTEQDSDIKQEEMTKILEQIHKFFKESKDEMKKSNNESKKNTPVDLRELREFKNIKKEIIWQRRLQLNLEQDNDTDTAAEVYDDEDKADIHGSVKNTKNGDRSKSEVWSSFSSSEERLLECKGLLASLPLIPYHTCDSKSDFNLLDEVSEVNSASYTVKSSGYYFFIYNNENEVKNNFIHAHFMINKTVYDTTGAVASCKNESKECSLPLTFWSREKTVLQLPNPDENGSWNEEFIFVSKCEPRSLLYLICFMSVPVCLLLFAFS